MGHTSLCLDCKQRAREKRTLLKANKSDSKMINGKQKKRKYKGQIVYLPFAYDWECERQVKMG